VNRDELIKYTEANADIGNECDVLKTDCDIIVYLFDNCEITVPNENRYFVDVNCIGVKNMVRKDRVQKYKQEKIDSGLILGETALAHTGAYDFGHTNAGWESVIELGIWGLRKRIDKYAEKTSDMKKLRFYQNIARVYDAALRFIKRAAEEAKVAGRCEMAAGLEHLRENSPSNLYEALQTSIVYYTLQQFFEGTPLRTLGRVDKLFYPYYKIEDKAIAHQMLYDYIMEVDRFKADANIPFAIGGTDIDGNSIVNELSYVMMDIYRNAGTADTKVHMFCSEDMPDDLLMQVFAGVRDGSNSIVFMNDGKVIESLEKLGEDHISASNYHVVGCYECGGDGELTCSCNARVSLPKALELALNKGRDMLTGELIGLENDGVFESFEDVYAEFARQISHIAKCAMRLQIFTKLIMI